MPPMRKRSNIWLHFTESADKIDQAKCKYCAQYLSTKSGSLGNLNRHLKNKHPTISIDIQRQPENIVSEVAYNPPIASTSSEVSRPTTGLRNPEQEPISNYLRRPVSSRKAEQIDNQLVKMIAKGHHALRLVEEPEFRKLIEMVMNCPGYQLPTRKTLRDTLIPKNYIEAFQNVRNKLSEEHAVCLSTDGWTSVTCDSYIAVTVHFINRQSELSSALLGCINYTEKHTSQNLMTFLKQLIIDWHLTNKVVCIVSDNAANILAAVRLGEWRSIGCFAHTLNLVVQHSLSQSRLGEIIKKTKNIVEFFKKSNVALMKLQEIQKQMGLPPLKLKQECPTRWNSCYDMLERILEIKDAVISTLAILKNEFALLPHEWTVIEEVVPILQPFYEVTTEISGEKYVSLSKVLLFVQLLSKHVVSTISQPNNDVTKDFATCLHAQVQIRLLDLEKGQLYAESTILDPRFKKRGFRTQEAFNKACESLRRKVCDIKLPDEDVQAVPITIAPSASGVLGTKLKKSVWDEYDTETSVITQPENPVAAKIRQFDKYIGEEYIHRTEDPLQWWNSRRNIYPHLYEYMLRRLCIQATSVSCERVFSNAGQILNRRRTLLKPNKVAQLLFLHANL